MANVLYPKLPADQGAYHLQVIGGMLNDLRNTYTADSVIVVKARKKLEKYRTASKTLGSVGTAIGVAGGTLGATGVGVIAGGSLIGVGAILGACSVVSMQLEKRVFDKLVKYEKLVSMTDSKIRTMERLVSKALSDGVISQAQYEEIYDEERKYKIQRGEILTPAKLVRQAKNSSSTRELADQLALLLKNLKRNSQQSE